MQKAWQTVVGLEIHAALCTKQKLFCSCANRFGAAPNTLCCPVCTGETGSIPVLNFEAVAYAVLLGHALHCKVNPLSYFDRKHYLYPDLPKGYQITQHEMPICQDGGLCFEYGEKKRFVEIERIQLEEDAGKLSYGSGGAIFVDQNRCGVPLVEIITKPQLHSAGETKECLEALAAILRCLGVSDVKMQEGSLRVDVNVSVRPEGEAGLGVRCEMKNINGFSAIYRAVEYEAARQIVLLNAGKKVHQETRRWDDIRHENTVLRAKEEAQDYQYMRESDLPPLQLEEAWISSIKETLPELPNEKITRYCNDFKLENEMAYTLVHHAFWADFFEQAMACCACKTINLAKWIVGDLAGILRKQELRFDDMSMSPRQLTQLVLMVDSGEISGAAGKAILNDMVRLGTEPKQLAMEKGLLQVSQEDALSPIIEQVLQENPQAIHDFYSGKKNAEIFFVGQGMKISGGTANPSVLRMLFQKKLNSMD